VRLLSGSWGELLVLEEESTPPGLVLILQQSPVAELRLSLGSLPSLCLEFFFTFIKLNVTFPFLYFSECFLNRFLFCKNDYDFVACLQIINIQAYG
jgi:hypothetical protein